MEFNFIRPKMDLVCISYNAVMLSWETAKLVVITTTSELVATTEEAQLIQRPSCETSSSDKKLSAILAVLRKIQISVYGL